SNGFIMGLNDTMKPLLQDPSRERPLPWWLWTVAFIITIGINIAKNGLVSIGVVSPSLLLVPHLAVALIARYGRKK
ncbi:MAG TPA: hypothetical protein PK263_02055, partial [bacterium]|nr:hypothetical protein [bacterium]